VCVEKVQKKKKREKDGKGSWFKKGESPSGLEKPGLGGGRRGVGGPTEKDTTRAQSLLQKKKWSKPKRNVIMKHKNLL